MDNYGSLMKKRTFRLLIINYAICCITKLVSVFIYHAFGPSLIICGIVFYYTRSARSWAVKAYYGLSVLSVMMALLCALQMLSKLLTPDTLISGKLLLGLSYVALAAIHVITSYHIHLCGRKR